MKDGFKNRFNIRIGIIVIIGLLFGFCLLLAYDISIRSAQKNTDLTQQGAEVKQAGNSETGTAADHDRIVFKLASTLSPDMSALIDLQQMADEVYEQTDGGLEIQLYSSSRLGDQNDNVNGVRIGTIEMCLASTAAIENMDPHFSIFAVPGLFKSPESVNVFYNSKICKEVLDNFKKNNGVRTLGLYHDGIRNVWLKSKKITRAADFAGLRLRIPEVAIREKEFAALGAETVPLPLGDCFVGLQSGYIDGLENNVETIMSSNIYEQVDYQIKTEHAYSTLLLLVNEEAYDCLDRETKRIFEASIEKCNIKAFDDYLKGQDAAYKAAEESGIVTIELSDAERKKIDDTLIDSLKAQVEELFRDDIFEIIRAL